MGKNKQTKANISVKNAATSGQRPSDKKLRKDGKRNKPTTDDHLQQIPFRLREILKSKERMKSKTSALKKRKKGSLSSATAGEPQKGDIPVPNFKRRKNETERAYVRRMENETNHVLFLTKNQVERKPELEADGQENPAQSKNKSEKKKEYDKGRLQKLHQKKLDRQEVKLEKEMFTDKVEFGDVALAPPTLNTKPKKAPVKSQGATMSGLLLNSLLGHAPTSTAKPSMARQRIMEEERQRAVEAYRRLKQQKIQQQANQAASLDKLKNLQ